MKLHLLLLLLLPVLALGQSRTITGVVVDENLERMPFVSIKNSDNMELASTNINGEFSITDILPLDTLTFTFISMEPAQTILNSDCDKVEIVMMNMSIFDYISIKKENRLRKRVYASLSKVYANAVKQGLFINENPCYIQKFRFIK